MAGKVKGKRHLGRIKRSREDNIKIELKLTGGEGVDSIHMAKDRVQLRAFVETVMNVRIT